MVISPTTNSTLLLEVNYLINSDYFLDLNYIYESLDDSEKDIVDKVGNTFKSKIKKAKDKESLIEIIKNTCTDILEEMEENPVQISVGAFLVLLAVILNTAIATLLRLLLLSVGVSVDTISLAAVCIAPVIEETLKRLSVRTKATGYHYLLFNLTEALSYIHMGVNPLLRIPPLIMHFLNTLIHKRSDTMNKNNDNNSKDFAATVGMHAAWNSLAVALPGGIIGIAAIIFTFAIQLYHLSNMQKESRSGKKISHQVNNRGLAYSH